MEGPYRQQMTIWRMSILRYVPKATHTHTHTRMEYVFVIILVLC
jgi:hypothetical protein